jgi:AraC family transcriptional regulator, L-rhamnose operon transcriptional activator RhaR
VAKLQPNHSPWTRHFEWGKCFRKPNRIEANFVKDHPDYPTHDHEFVELALIVSGTCLHLSGLGEQQVAAGDVFLFRPGAWHEYKNVESLCIYNCCFDPALLGLELGWMVSYPALGRLLWSLPLAPAQHGTVALHLDKAEIARARKVLDELCTLTQQDHGSQFGEHLGLLVQFLSIVSNFLPAPTPDAPRAKIHPGVTTAIKLMDDNPSDPWTLPLLAEKVGLRPDYLCRLFGEIVGISPINYLNRRRLELATGLLRHTPLPVGEVGAAVGWTDANYFARRFNEKFGVSPSQYRTRFKRVRQEKREQD